MDKWINKMWYTEAPIKMAEWKDVELTPSHKYIKNTLTNDTVLTEHLLNTSRRPQTPERTRKISM